jgi:hypothetical protein
MLSMGMFTGCAHGADFAAVHHSSAVASFGSVLVCGQLSERFWVCWLQNLCCLVLSNMTGMYLLSVE